MKMCININGFAFVQKLIGWVIVILAVQSGFSVVNIIISFLGLAMCEFADIWYKYSTELEKSAQLMVGKP